MHKIIARFRDGTLSDALRRRVGLRVPGQRARWDGADTVEDAVSALSRIAKQHVSTSRDWVLIVGDEGPLQRRLEQVMKRSSIRSRSTLPQSLTDMRIGTEPPAIVLNACVNVRQALEIARTLTAHGELAGVPFESVGGLERERAMFAKWDEYPRTYFVSPVLLDRPSPYQIYEDSLSRFEQKCGLRDYLDLYQLLKDVVRRSVPGDIAEFGSFRGHSGWLIAQTLKALGSDKRVFLFDTFESFPQEGTGVDHFWSGTHKVDFDEVRSKFRDLDKVQFVRGDFTRTLPDSGLGKVALAYIDCDSYRATRFLIQALWDARLGSGAALVCEDYGHPALLGNRVAVHEMLDARTDAIRFFSQFSGLYIAIKT